MVDFLKKKNNARSVLDATISDSDLSIIVADASVFPSEGNFLLTIWNRDLNPDPTDDVSMEIVKVTSVETGNILIIERAQENTIARSHSINDTIALLLTAATLEELETEINNKLNIGSTTADVNSSSNRRYVTDVELSILLNTSGINSGDETLSTIKTKLGITTLSGSNTGDQDLSSYLTLSDISGKENSSNKSTSVISDGSSDSKYPSVKAIKDYADSLVVGLLDYRGGYDASGNVYPSSGGSASGGLILKGDTWVISVAGTLGGNAIQVGDSIIANVDSPGSTSSNWNTLNGNISYVPENQANKVTSISGSSTDVQYPSAKLLYDQLALKQGSITTGTTSQYFRGDLSLATFPTALSSFSNDSNFITLGSLSGTSGISYNNSTGVISLNLGTSNTFTGQQIFNTTAPQVGTATISTIASFDASKNLVSLATAIYPSLTELSYVKGVTSAIQTQLSAIVSSQWTLSSTNLYSPIADTVTVGTDSTTYDTFTVNTPTSLGTTINGISTGVGGNDSFTKLLLPLDGSNLGTTFTDISQSAKAVTRHGSVVTSTTQVKFGTASAKFSSTGDGLSVLASSDFNFAAGNFTIEGYYQPTSLADTQVFFLQRDDGNNAIQCVINPTSGTITFTAVFSGVTAADYRANSLSFSTGTWYHIALVRNGTSFNIYVNGVAASLTVFTAISTNTFGNLTSVFVIGARQLSGTYDIPLLGYLDQFRISKGIARWTANFTPASGPYTSAFTTPILSFANNGSVIGNIQFNSSTNAMSLVNNAVTSLSVDSLGNSTMNSLALSGTLTISANNIITDTSTGLKIGTSTTQKLGFFNATPIVQVGATIDLGVVLSNLGFRASGTAYTITTSGTKNFGDLSVSQAVFTDGSKNLVSNAITGTGNVVMSTSPTLVTPILGVATVTSLNKVTITVPASSATLTIIDGKTLTVNNTIALSGTDSTTMTFPTTSATIARTDAANTFTGIQTFSSTITGSISGNSGTATVLATARAIYGNNFDGSVALTQIIASTYGGTGNGFTKFSGPTTSEKTFTLPDANATILTTNTTVTVAQGGTGAATLTGIVLGNGTSAFTTVTAPSGTIIGTTDTQTLTNKRITKRVVTASDATSITPNSDNADITYQANTQALGTLTINADTGTPTNGQSWLLKIKSTNVQTFSWNSIFVGGTIALPTTTSGSSKYDYYSFIYDTAKIAWEFTGFAGGF